MAHMMTSMTRLTRWLAVFQDPLYIPRVVGLKTKINAHLLVKFNAWTSLKGSRIEIQVNHRSQLKDRVLRVLNLLRPPTVMEKICHKETFESWQRTMYALTYRTSCFYLSCSWHNAFW